MALALQVTAALLQSSAQLGARVARLLDVTDLSYDARFKNVALVTRSDGQAVDPDAGAVKLSWNWGYKSGAGVTMPGNGHRLERAFAPGENADYPAHWPAQTLDLGLWRAEGGGVTTTLGNVPIAVWDFTLGGYGVLKKWMSYRDEAVIGRALTRAEAMELSLIARKIASLIALQSALDENYRACCEGVVTVA